MGFKKKILIENSLCSPVFHLTDDNTSRIEGSRCGGKKYDLEIIPSKRGK